MRRSSHGVHCRKARRAERGFAIVVVLLIVTMLGLLGTSYLLMADTERRIAESERLSAQALFAAEAGTRIVKRWFDAPMSSENLRNPSLAAIDRTLRLIDGDGDPNTAPVAADGSAGLPYYKQGVDRDADGQDDVFRTPYRGSLADALLGTEDGPDIRIDENASSDARTFLRDLSPALLGDYPGGGLAARITSIDVYGPPYVLSAGNWVRYGMGTVRVVSRIYRDGPGGAEEVYAERMVRIVINEVPYSMGGELGPLHSCDNLGWNGEFTVHWGVATAVNAADLHNNHEKQAVSLPRVPSPSSRVDLLWGWNDAAAFTSYMTTIDGLRVQDPWLRLVFGGSWAEAPNADPQPFPFTWTPGTPLQDGDLPYHPGPPGPHPYPQSWDGTHSNIFQNTPVGCPDMDYAFWKSVATSGGSGVHYYAWASGDTFREDGIGTARSFRNITDQQTGFFFFDTRDGLAPRDDDADGEFDNLTPGIQISGGRWGVRGVIFLNAAEFQSHGIQGRPVAFRAPGEPFRDVNENGRWDAGETWVNLRYPTTLAGRFTADSGDRLQDDGTTGATVVRNARGPVINADAVLWGLLYNSGYYDATGNGVYYGTVISRQGIGELNPSAGTPDHYWDESLRDSWPPDDWGLPRVAITRWETDL